MAASTPRGMPTTMRTRADAAPSWAEMTSPFLICLKTGWLVSMDLPQSPTASPPA